MKTIKIALVGTPYDYPDSLLPLVIRNLGYSIQWARPAACDLLIFGAFYRPREKRYRWLPKPVRPLAVNVEKMLKNDRHNRKNKPVRLFHTAENIRHDAVEADYAISFDLSVNSSRHFRFPYWMEMVDWSHEGLTGNQNPRFGQLLNIAKLMQPLGNSYLNRPLKAAIFSSHLREPRATLVNSLKNFVPVDGFGPHFNRDIIDHHNSGIKKFDTLQNYALNLCPENGLYPGYYTEKIPEAFSSGCLPLTWTDTNVCVDFNPQALINLEPMSWQNFDPLKDILNSPARLKTFSEQPLLLQAPSIQPLREFLINVVQDAVS
jgi:hypothetical protein